MPPQLFLFKEASLFYAFSGLFPVFSQVRAVQGLFFLNDP
jgi:hypothetical protein